MQLAVAGAEGRVFAPILSVGHASPFGDFASVTYMGYVPDQDLPALYSGATAVLLPSLYEGFGLGVLEAMACGAPVIASGTTSFPEVVGEAGISVDPTDPNGIAEAMRQISEEDALAPPLRPRGRQRAKQFTWDESARRIQKLVESL